MKITAFDPTYSIGLGTGDTYIGGSSGSNAGYTGGDVTGESGDLSVVGLRQRVSLSSNMGDNTIGSVLTTIQSSPWLATFALPSNTGAADVETVGVSGSAVTLDYNAATWWDITLTANCTLTITNPPVSATAGQLHVVLRQGGVGSYTVTWPGSVDWPDTDGTGGGSAPTLWTAIGAQDVITLTTLDGGTTWGGSYDADASSASPLTTKGDLYGYTTTNARFAVGSNGTGIIVDPAESLGLRYTLAALSGELLMADGVTAPPVPIESDPGQDDWLYGDM